MMERMILMSLDNQALPPASIREDGQYSIDLTGPGSHILDIRRGVGSLSIGPPELGNKADLHVAPDDPIQWSVFDPFATPAGSPWPRHLTYTGNDSGFLEWAQTRPIEQMNWKPLLSADVQLDASLSRMHGFFIELKSSTSGCISLKLPNELYYLTVSGELSRFVATGTLPSMLVLAPSTSRRKTESPLQLPEMGELQGVTNLTLQGSSLGQPISLNGLDRFPHLESLSLWGSFSHMDALARHPGLRNLELRFIPELGDMPPLETWPELDRFIAYNVEEAGGKRLRQQMKARAKTRPWSDYASVSQLRKPEWWVTEFGRPFASWPKRLAKLANEAYTLAQTSMAEARSIAEAEAILTAFTRRFNGLKGIETIERDDLGEAVWQLSQSPHLIGQPIPEETAQGWFDAVRDY